MNKLYSYSSLQVGWLSPTERASVSAISLRLYLATSRESRRYVVAGASIWLRQESLRHVLASSGYAPGTIAINFTWMEREFNACQTNHSMYPSIINRIGRKLRHFHTPPLFSGPAGVTPSEFREDLDRHKARMTGLSCGEESMRISSAVLIKYQRVTDGRTDRRLTHVKTVTVCSLLSLA